MKQFKLDLRDYMMVGLVVSVVIIGLSTGLYINQADAQTTNGPVATPDALQAFALSNPVPVMQMDPNGWWTPRLDFAAHEWHPGTDIPDRPDGLIIDGRRVLRWPIVAVPKVGNPIIMWFGKDDPKDETEKGRFRSSNWSVWTTPERWAYLRMGPEVWNESQKRMVVPGFEQPTPPVSTVPNPAGIPKKLQHIMDGLTYEYPPNLIQDAMDNSQYKLPQTGAPFSGSEPLSRASQQMYGHMQESTP